ncbi:MAG: GIY-YIG nuclease family protein [bacterium]
MNKKFKSYIDQMPTLAKEFDRCQLVIWGDRKDLPDAGGIYVLYENGKPIYVGRTRNFKRRLREHGSKSSGHNSAPFAFNLAREKYTKEHKLPRVELEKLPEFREEFEIAKERVRNMRYKIVTVEDPIAQHMFEVYLSFELHTEKYNDFDTH